MHNASQQAVCFIRARSIGTSDDEAMEAMQVEHQRRACQTMADGLGVTIVREYVERGGTGPIERRPTLRLMLDELTALHDAAYVITYAHDRLTRRTNGLASIELELAGAGAGLVITNTDDDHSVRYTRLTAPLVNTLKGGSR